MLQTQPASTSFLLHMKEVHVNCQGADMIPRLVRSWGAREGLQVFGNSIRQLKGKGKGEKENNSTVKHVVARLPHLRCQPSDLR